MLSPSMIKLSNDSCNKARESEGSRTAFAQAAQGAQCRTPVNYANLGDGSFVLPSERLSKCSSGPVQAPVPWRKVLALVVCLGTHSRWWNPHPHNEEEGKKTLCIPFTKEAKQRGSTDLDERIKGLLLVVFWDDFCQELVFALGQFDKGTNAVNVRIDLNVEDVIPPCKGKMALRENKIHTELPAAPSTLRPWFTQGAQGSSGKGDSGFTPILV